MAVESYKLSYIQKQKKRKRTVIVFFSFLSVLAFLQILFLFIIRPLGISSNSMMPEFNKNSAVFIAPLINSKTLFSQETELLRGSLVTIDNGTIEEKSIFKNIISFIISAITFQKIRPYENTRWGDTEIYRIIGLPGDTLYIDNYVAYVRQGGASHFLTEFELSNIEYDIFSHEYPDNWNMSIGAQGKTDEISLRQGEYFLLCDNRIVSTDSRIFGAVKSAIINGKVIAQYFPFNLIRTFQ